MAIGIPSQEENLFLPTIETIATDAWPRPSRKVDPLAIVLLGLLIFLAIQLLLDGRRTDTLASQAANSSATIEKSASSELNGQASAGQADPQLAPSNPSRPIFPYDNYWITQGPHGFSYGHMAIDLAAGKGAIIKSPIQGDVTANYVDVYGNTTLVVENEHYQVILLHGDYSAAVGQEVSSGDPLGSESNNGYTTDMQGRSCRGRDCGHHTHLNVYDKEAGQNINPLDILIDPAVES